MTARARRAPGDGRRRARRRGSAPRSPTPASTRCSSPASRTSATSPGSPARPAMLLVTADDAGVRHRRPLPHAGGRAARRRRRRRAASRSAPPSPRSATRSPPRSPPGRAPRPRGARGHVGAAAGRSPTTVRRRTSSSPTEGLVERLRRVKEPAEVARIRAACAIADDALGALLPTLADGPTERDFALELEVEMRRRGASGNSFDPIVASGPERREAARPPERPARSSAASSSSSTSAASSTGTAPT